MKRSRWSRTLVVLLLVASMVALVGAGSALAQPPERVKVLIGFTHQPGPAEQALVHRAGGTIKYTYHLVPAIAASIPEATIDGLRRNPNVTNIDLDLEVYAIGQDLPWGIDRIDAELVHAYNKGTGVAVAVIDTGIDKDHPDLESNIKGGVNFVRKGRFVNPDAWDDDNGHGTHVAGTIGAVDNDIGVIGVAPEAHLYGVKVLNRSGGGLYSDVIAGIEWAVENKIQVTNNSYGSPGDPGPTVKEAFDNAYAAGVLNVCAAGNEYAGEDTVIYPARYDSCIAVAATDINNNRASFSSTGPDVELAAPGVNILSTVLGGGYEDDGWNGTSMASPHVAGTAALVIASGVTANVDVRLRLQITADDLGPDGQDNEYGYGLVDADEAAPPAGPVNDPPTVSITSPADGSPFDSGATILFEGTASDPEEGDLTASLVWTSSIDGGIGEGGSFSAILSDGNHTITAEVTDSGGNTGSASIGITVTPPPNDPPIVSISSPADGSTFDSGAGILFEGTASDTEDGDLTASLSWTSSIEDDPIDTGGSFSATLSDGDHTITAEVTDSGGKTGSESVNITVGTPPVEPEATMHVASIEMSYATPGRNYKIYTKVKIVDADNAAVEGATVYLRTTVLPDGPTATGSGDTRADGTVTFVYGPTKTTGTYESTVTNVVKAGWIYDETANVETSASLTVP